MDYTEYNAGHLTGQPTAADVVPHEPVVFEDPVCFEAGPTLTAQEVAYFKEHGFVVKRRMIDDRDACAQAVQHLWNNVPGGILRPDEPAGWQQAHEKWTNEYVARVGRLNHGNWKMRSPGAAGIGTEPFLVDRIANHPNMIAVGAALLGGPIKPPRRVRGIYAVFPKSPRAQGRLGPHADYMAAQLSAMVLIDETPPHCGGFTLWPGSHLRLHPHWDTVHGGQMASARGEGFRLARDDVLRDITPVELAGSAGDVVFWHPRMLHSAGVNHTAEPTPGSPTPIVRMVVPCDYQRAGLSYFDDDQYGPGERYQWWVDTRNFREDVAATADNIWHGWAI